MRDPNPGVKGQGIETLRDAGIETKVDVCSSEARELNLAWAHWVKTGRPFVALHYTTSVDGKIAFPDGKTKWLSSPVSRAHRQRLRRHADAVIIGAEAAATEHRTLRNLTGQGAQPLRVVVDPELELSPEAGLFTPLRWTEHGPYPIVLIASTSRGSFERRKALELAGAEVLVLEDEFARVDLDALLVLLGQRGIQAVLCEAGASVVRRMLAEALCNRLLVYRVPLFVGPDGAVLFPEDSETPPELPELSLLWSRKVGLDALSVYTVGKAAAKVPGE